jgi:hypothetical protein
MLGDEFLKDRLDLGQVVSGAGKMIMRAGYGNWHHALRRADIDEGFIILPREFRGDCLGRAEAYPAHRGEEPAQPVRIGIEHREHVAGVLGLVLVPAGLERLGQKTPGTIKPGIGHFEKAANVAWLPPVQKQIRVRRVAVAPILAVEHFQRDKRVKEIARRAIVQAEPARQIGEIGRTLGKLGEQAKLDRAQQRLGFPKTKSKFENIGGRYGIGHGAPPSMMASPLQNFRYLNRDTPDGRRIERNSASIRFPLQGEAVALADRRVVTTKSN